MATSKLTNVMVGYFDVRVYKAGVEPKNRKFIGEDETIKFNVSFKADECPEELIAYAKIYESKDHEQRKSVTFKIGKKCKWYNENSTCVPKPSNEDLEGKAFIVRIDYTQLDGDPSSKDPRGYWANAIMFKEKPTNPFEGMRFESDGSQSDGGFGGM